MWLRAVNIKLTKSLVPTTREKKESKVEVCVPLASAAWGHSIVANKGVDDWNHFPARQMRPSASFFIDGRRDKCLLIELWRPINIIETDNLVRAQCTRVWCQLTSQHLTRWSIDLFAGSTGDRIECPAWIFHTQTGAWGKGRAATVWVISSRLDTQKEPSQRRSFYKEFLFPSWKMFGDYFAA